MTEIPYHKGTGSTRDPRRPGGLLQGLLMDYELRQAERDDPARAATLRRRAGLELPRVKVLRAGRRYYYERPDECGNRYGSREDLGGTSWTDWAVYRIHEFSPGDHLLTVIEDATGHHWDGGREERNGPGLIFWDRAWVRAFKRSDRVLVTRSGGYDV